MNTGANPRVAFRVKPELKERIQTAAALMGLTVTDFVVSTLSERASEVVDRQLRINLSDRDRDLFLSALARGGQPLPVLVETLKKQQSPGDE